MWAHQQPEPSVLDASADPGRLGTPLHHLQVDVDVVVFSNELRYFSQDGGLMNSPPPQGASMSLLHKREFVVDPGSSSRSNTRNGLNLLRRSRPRHPGLRASDHRDDSSFAGDGI